MWTEGVYDIVEYPPDMRLELDRALECYLPQWRPHVVDRLHHALRTAEPFCLRVQVRGARSERVKWVELRGHPHHTAEGQVDYLMGTIQDITERTHAEDVLRESEARFRTVFDRSPVAILIHDKDTGAVVDANSTAWSAYGLNSLEALQHSDMWTEPPHSLADALRWIERAVHAGRASTSRNGIRRRSVPYAGCPS